MNLFRIKYCLYLVIATAITSIASISVAADCLAIRKKIKQERDIILKSELVKTGLKSCPKDPVINFSYAYSMERFRKYDTALKHYGIAAKLDPKFAKSYFGMGDMFMQLENPNFATKSFKKGLNINPDDKRARRSLEKAEKALKTNRNVKPGAKLVDLSILGLVTEAKKPVIKAPSTVSTKVKKQSIPTAKVINEQDVYKPAEQVTISTPRNQLPVVVNPMQGEAIQSINFNIAKDNTGKETDNKMTQ